jgi:Ca2+-binding EF-hand superfamily protein
MDEAPEQLQGAFGMVDANADGSIDLEEAQMIADFINGQ